MTGIGEFPPDGEGTSIGSNRRKRSHYFFKR